MNLMPPVSIRVSESESHLPQKARVNGGRDALRGAKGRSPKFGVGEVGRLEPGQYGAARRRRDGQPSGMRAGKFCRPTPPIGRRSAFARQAIYPTSQ
ncbi:Hypothetical protein NTJ_10720 [Nesidiocoris tenuis]|uniref:Uncharacterized protein n=1 Tax=Nesidiocoris tenuis TaxID=355587 RepID=A0ABN7B2U3_9HEMI|nr:Hypothetical protein NTJ_10720 [Nesidiocoris tenuis]